MADMVATAVATPLNLQAKTANKALKIKGQIIHIDHWALDLN